MSTDRLTAVIADLDAIQGDLEEEVQRLRSQLASAESELESVKKSRQALGGKPKSKASTSKAPKKVDVVTALHAVMKERQIDRESIREKQNISDLQGWVKEKLTTAGLSHAGFALRFKEAVAGLAGTPATEVATK